MAFKFARGERARKVPPEIAGADLGSTGVKVIRVRNNKRTLSLVGADILPRLDLPDAPEGHAVRFRPPNNLQTNYVAITVSGRSSNIRLLSLTGHTAGAELTEAKVRELVGAGPDMRLGYTVLPLIKGKAEKRVLAVSMPEKEIQTILSLVPSGPPAAYSIEVSGLAALTAFERGVGADCPYDGVIVIEAGVQTTLIALYAKRHLMLIRKFDFGGDSVLAKVQQQLGVDRETAQGIIADGSFDISQPVHEVMDPFLRQLTISRDFVERREECSVGAVFLSGGVTLSRYWAEELYRATGLEIVAWNPLAQFSMSAGSFPEQFVGQESRFAAAAGAVLGVFAE